MKSKAKHVAYIGLGANLGNPQGTIKTALARLGSLPSTQLIRASSLYLSAPLDAEGDDYINAVAALHTQQNPEELLRHLQALEQQFGRTRAYQNAPRTLDLDLLLYEQRTINTPELQIPHPRMMQRAFVILPLLEIAPNVSIPTFGTAQSLLPSLCHQRIQKIS